MNDGFLLHRGRRQPTGLRNDDRVEVVFRDGERAAGTAGEFYWPRDPHDRAADILAWRPA